MGPDPNPRGNSWRWIVSARGIEHEILPVCERYGLGVLVWSPLAMGLLAGRLRRGSAETASAGRLHWARQHLTDERKLDTVEVLARIAEQAGLSLPHLALAFVTAHPAVTSAIIGPRTPEQLDDLLAGAGTLLDDDLLDRIDEIVPPGTDVGRSTLPTSHRRSRGRCFAGAPATPGQRADRRHDDAGATLAPRQWVPQDAGSGRRPGCRRLTGQLGQPPLGRVMLRATAAATPPPHRVPAPAATP